jgi:hypothetical protein
MKKISVVTVDYNTHEATIALLKSLEKIKTSGFTLEIIVVDNGSEKKLEIGKKQNIKLVRLEENTGFTGGYNFGMKIALASDADYILIINNDTIVDQDLIVELQKVLERDKNIGIAVPKIYFARGHEFHKERYKKEDLGKVFWYAGGFIDWENVQSVHKGVDEVDHGQYDEIKKVEFATGCCMMFKREVLEKIGFFDEKYFLYFEDADLSERIKRAGYAIYFAPKAILYHLNASSSGGAGRGNALQDYFITRNQMLFGFSYAPVRAKIALIKQSLSLRFNGRPEQKKAIKDFYSGKFGKGTFFEK